MRLWLVGGPAGIHRHGRNGNSCKRRLLEQTDLQPRWTMSDFSSSSGVGSQCYCTGDREFSSIGAVPHSCNLDGSQLLVCSITIPPREFAFPNATSLLSSKLSPPLSPHSGSAPCLSRASLRHSDPSTACALSTIATRRTLSFGTQISGECTLLAFSFSVRGNLTVGQGCFVSSLFAWFDLLNSLVH